MVTPSRELLQALYKDNQYKETDEEKLQRLLTKPLLTGRDIFELPYKKNDYVLEGFLWRNDITILVAKEKVGKTILLTQIACALTCGEKFLGSFKISRPQKVLYIQTEGTMYQTQENMAKTISEGGVKWNPDNWMHMFCPAIALDKEEGLEYVKSRIDDASNNGFKPDVIFIDTLYMSLSGKLTDDTSARAFCGNIRRLQETYNCSFIISHHEHRTKRDNFGGKIDEGDDAIHGSFVWKAFPSHVMRLTRNLRTGLRTLTCSTSRNGKAVEELKMQLVQMPLMFEVSDSELTMSSSSLILKTIKNSGEITFKQLEEITQLSESSIKKNIASLQRDNLITVKRVGRSAYYLATEGNSDEFEVS